MDDRWVDELADEFRHGFLTDLIPREIAVREEPVDGETHVAEGCQRDNRRTRAATDDWQARTETDDWWSNGPPE